MRTPSFYERAAVLDIDRAREDPSEGSAAAYLAEAQVYAILALAAATYLNGRNGA